MVRFRNVDSVDAIVAHNEVFEARGKVLWGLWLKQFENEKLVANRLISLGSSLKQIYVADTSQKAEPTIYVASVARVITDNTLVDEDIVPEYYRGKINEVPVWFELSGRLLKIDVDNRLPDVLGVPTIYFLDYEKGRVVNIEPQREFDKIRRVDPGYVLHLTDIHLGEDHGFRQPWPEPRQRADIAQQPTFADVLKKDLSRLGLAKKISCVVISGDIVTRGGWDKTYRFGNSEMTGLQAAKYFLEDLSNTLDVPPEFFFVVPGNHDIVRQTQSSSTEATKFLLDYKHESGFRALREDFCDIYRLAPLNYVVKLEVGSKKLLLGLLNSAYLNDQAGFVEYGFVGDDAEHVFKIMEGASEFSKVLVLHHHVLPVYEREVLGKDNTVSLTLDAANIMRRAQEVGVDVVLHGHQHFAKLMNYCSWSPEMEKRLRPMKSAIRVVAGGSAGASSGRLPGSESNTYGLLNLASQNLSVRLRRIYPNGRLGENW